MGPKGITQPAVAVYAKDLLLGARKTSHPIKKKYKMGKNGHK